MTTHRETVILGVLKAAEDTTKSAAVALKNRCVLSGSTAHARRFQAREAALVNAERDARRVLSDLNVPEDVAKNIAEHCNVIRSADGLSGVAREGALRQLRRTCEIDVLPAARLSDEPETPTAEDLLPLSLIKDTRGYLYKTALQANGNMERGWTDGAALMVRRLIELLIIEVYEGTKRMPEIQNGQGDVLGLDDLINHLLNDSAFHLARETRRLLPVIRKTGNRSAHARRYSATKQELLKLAGDLRIAADELLHLAGLR